MHLQRGADRADEVDALAERRGGRVGLAGVLGDLDRRARVVRVPAPAAVWGFRWDREDMRSARWWPQGITTSADSASGDTGIAVHPDVGDVELRQMCRKMHDPRPAVGRPAL